MEKEVGWKSGA